MSLSPVPQNIPSNMKSYAFFLFLFSDQFFSVISCFFCALFPRPYHYCSIPLYMLQLINVRACVISCPTLCDPMDYSLPGSSIHGIFQARILEWVATSSSRGSSRPRDQTCVSCIGRQILYHCATWEAPS